MLTDPRQVGINIQGFVRLAVDVNDRKNDREFNTVYHNNSEAVRVVAVGVTFGAAQSQGMAIAYIGEDVQPSLACGVEHIDIYPGGAYHTHGTITFLVNPGWYYKVQKLSQLTLYSWVEWDVSITDEPPEEE